ncbi:transcription repressor NadR [Desertibacillus haloalkaliphilus]|uniref:transcription repressor NadR n=1 Tax=Desertibacillus haloalkaliphilus TaxID=1328930 RepID=UPI001C26A45F|nr:transcription repressor NadR [Desertibacillus haloalkaliphilus]MBU8905483.1 transcription repressor NadR [Desertibacillus haloalkaliphilus]
MDKGKKLLGEKRREFILQSLQHSQQALTGSELSEKTNVSRQVIVQDISILKARNYPIIATSQGYMMLNEANTKIERIIACQHHADDTREELQIIVDHGASVKNVMVEHPVYGDLTASLLIHNRRDVENFLAKMKETNANLLADLTDGTHLHTIEADTKQQLNDTCEALKKAGFLLSS